MAEQLLRSRVSSVEGFSVTSSPFGFALAGVAVCFLSLFSLDKQQYHSRNWSSAVATIVSQSQKCAMHNTSHSGFLSDDVMIDCRVVADFRSSHTSGRWHSDRVTMLTIRFKVNGEAVDVEAARHKIASGSAKIGGTLQIVYNPEDTKKVDRPVARFDQIAFFAAQGVGALMIFAGFIRYRRQRDEDSWSLGQRIEHFNAD
jgi:hypothetical protein